jgi:hypothetical protein
LKEKIEANKFVISDNITNVPYLEYLTPSSSGMIFVIYNGIPLGENFKAMVLMLNTLLT